MTLTAGGAGGRTVDLLDNIDSEPPRVSPSQSMVGPFVEEWDTNSMLTVDHLDGRLPSHEGGASAADTADSLDIDAEFGQGLQELTKEQKMAPHSQHEMWSESYSDDSGIHYGHQTSRQTGHQTWIRTASSTSVLGQGLNGLRSQLAQAAQQVVDEWTQDDEGIDCELGGGGPCERVAAAMADVINTSLPDVNITEGGQEGDDHAWLIVSTADEAYEVDIPPGVYETGGGYSWKKLEGAQITAGDVVIAPIPRHWIEAALSRAWVEKAAESVIESAVTNEPDSGVLIDEPGRIAAYVEGLWSELRRDLPEDVDPDDARRAVLETALELLRRGHFYRLEGGRELTAARDIVVSIPVARLREIEVEERDVRAREAEGEQGIEYFWRMGQLPKEQPGRIFFAWDGAVRAYHDVTRMDRGARRLYMTTQIHEIEPISMPGFRGFRYFDAEVDRALQREGAVATDVEFRNELTGASGEQTDGILIAHRGGANLGYVSWSKFRGVIYVNMLEVRPEARRQGVGSALILQLRREFPGVYISEGYKTDEGMALMETVTPQEIEDPRIKEALDQAFERVDAHWSSAELLELASEFAQRGDPRASILRDMAAHDFDTGDPNEVLEAREQLLMTAANTSFFVDETDMAQLTRPNHLYRGMSEGEYNTTIAAGKPLVSDKRWCHSSEMTCYAEGVEHAESFANFGRTDPRKTGTPTYVIEVEKPEQIVPDPRDYYYKTDEMQPADVRRVWRFDSTPDGRIKGTLQRPCIEPTPACSKRRCTGQRMPWVAVDLDGTLLAYEPGMAQRDEFGEALPGAKEALAELMSLGWRVSIYTARLSELTDEEADAAAEKIASFLRSDGFEFTDVWVGRKPRSDFFIDDRALHFDGDWAQTLSSLLIDEGGHENDNDVNSAVLIDTQDGDPNDFEPRHDLSVRPELPRDREPRTY